MVSAPWQRSGSAEYEALPRDAADEALEQRAPRRHSKPLEQWLSWKNIVIAVLVGTNVLTILFSIASSSRHSEGSAGDMPITQDLPATTTRFSWYTGYSSEDDSVSDPLWDAIKPSHGFIAVDPTWAASQHWPESMTLPNQQGEPEKHVYLLEAYHQIHCLKIIRNTIQESIRGQPFSFPLHHTWHCIDAFRQTIQCNADSTPLFTFGNGTSGIGQARQCRDWDSLRKYATEHSACYIDDRDKSPFHNHYGVCDDGTDGLPATANISASYVMA